MKKIFAGMLASAMMLSIAGTTYAFGWSMPKADINIENEDTHVTTIARSSATTGSNVQFGGSWSKINTGSVSNLSALSEAQVNATILPSCNCSNVGDITIENEHTRVMTVAKVGVTTGENKQMSFTRFSMPQITTGGVSGVGAGASSIVNYTDFSVGN